MLIKINNEIDSDITNYIAPQKRKFKFNNIRASVSVPSSHTQKGEHAADNKNRQKKDRDRRKNRYRDYKNTLNIN